MILFCELQQISTCVSRILESSVKDRILSKFACESLTCMLSSSSLKFYLPQRSCGKVMFYTGVCYSVHRRGPSWADTPWADTPPLQQTPPPPMGRHPPSRHPLPSACWDTPPAQCMLGYTPLPQRPLQRTVRILLECILVFILVMGHK